MSRFPGAILCDKDGTLIVDVPYNGDPALVQPLPGVGAALARARRAGLAIAIVSNQSGVARGLLTAAELATVLARCEDLLGPFDAVLTCPHGEDDGCACRKPAPGMVLAAAHDLGLSPSACVMIGDTGADTDAALAAGAGAILVPNDRTLEAEVRRAPAVAPTFSAAVDLALEWLTATGAADQPRLRLRPPPRAVRG